MNFSRLSLTFTFGALLTTHCASSATSPTPIPVDVVALSLTSIANQPPTHTPPPNTPVLISTSAPTPTLSHQPQTVRLVADVSGDNMADIVGFNDFGVMVSLSDGSSFLPPTQWLDDLGFFNGWRTDNSVRTLADVDGDGRADIVGLLDEYVITSISNSRRFREAKMRIDGFNPASGVWQLEPSTRLVGDVSGDDLADVVGVDERGVLVSRATAEGFAPPEYWVGAPDRTGELRPPLLADVSGDTWADLIIFSPDGVLVARSDSRQLKEAERWTREFGAQDGRWASGPLVQHLADVDGDEILDLITFAADGVWVNLTEEGKFATSKMWSAEFGAASGQWQAHRNPRLLADVNGDGLADVVGFADYGVLVALSTGDSFGPSQLWIKEFGYLVGGWE